MKKQAPLSLLGLLIFCSSTAVFSQEQAPAPSFKDGQRWQFKINEKFIGLSNSNVLDGIYELVVVGGDIQVVKLTDGQREPVTARAGILRELVGKNQPERPDFKFPLSSGQKWSYEYSFKSTGARTALQRTVEITVTGPDEVTTAAGSFKALKIRKEDTARGYAWITTHYWSADTNSVVKSSFDTTQGGGEGVKREVELIKFSSNP